MNFPFQNALAPVGEWMSRKDGVAALKINGFGGIMLFLMRHAGGIR
jgi:hypothetical protein